MQAETLRASAIAVVEQCQLESTPFVFPPASLAHFFCRALELEPGFIDVFGCFEETSGSVVWVTVWETEADALRFHRLNRSTLEELRWILESGEISARSA